MRTSRLHRLHTGEDPLLVVDKGRFHYTLTTATTTEPVTLAEAKLFARIDDSTDDALVTALIIAARQNVEKQTGRTILSQTWTATLDFLPGANTFELINRPIQSVTSIKAFNEDGTSDFIDAGDILIDGANGRVSIINDATITGDRAFKAFEIVYVTGYGATEADAPEWAKLVIKIAVAHWYEHREAATEKGAKEIPFAAQMIIDQNCVVEL